MNSKLLLAAGIVVVVGGTAAAYLYINRPDPAPAPTVLATPTPSPTISPGFRPRGNAQTTQLKAVGGYSGEGEATRGTSGGRFSVSLTVQLPDPGPGKFYEAWLERKTPFATFSIGKLTKEGDAYALRFEQARDASAYDNLVVTLETADDKKRETSVLEASF